MEIVEQIVNKVIEGNIAEVKRLTREAVEKREDAQKLIDQGFIPGLDVVGEKFSAGEFFLPEMLVAAMAVKEGMELLSPLLIKSDIEPKGTIVFGTVEGDMHDIGKNIVCMMLEGAGYKVIDLGVDVSAEKFINAAKTSGADMIAMSALLSSTRAGMERIIQDIHTSELITKVKVMVGGAPVTHDFAEMIRADGYAPDAGVAVKKTRELLGAD